MEVGNLQIIRDLNTPTNLNLWTLFRSWVRQTVKKLYHLWDNWNLNTDRYLMVFKDYCQIFRHNNDIVIKYVLFKESLPFRYTYLIMNEIILSDICFKIMSEWKLGSWRFIMHFYVFLICLKISVIKMKKSFTIASKFLFIES